MEFGEEGRRPVGGPKKNWSKVVEEDMRKLKITEDMASSSSSSVFFLFQNQKRINYN